MKIRILKKSDGSVAIVHPAPKSRRPDETEEEWFLRVADKSTPNGIAYEDVPNEKLPATREYRGAWEWDGIHKQFKVNSVKKKAIDDAKKNKEDEKQSAIAKLENLGLTVEELKTLLKT